MLYNAEGRFGRVAARNWHRLVARLGCEGTNLLGVLAVIAETYERITAPTGGHGVLPLAVRRDCRPSPDEELTVTCIRRPHPAPALSRWCR
jgi:aconitase A